MKRILLLPPLLATFHSAWGGVITTCYADITSTAPDIRYIDNGDGTVTDSVTNLMWKQCVEGLSTTATPCDTGTSLTPTWQAALQQAENVNTGGGFAGYTDWRVPSQRELQSLVERACSNPTINANFFPGNTADVTWSSSPVAGTPGSIWSVFFGDGRDIAYAVGSAGLVRLVRDR